MAGSKKTPNVKNIVALGAQRLAESLIGTRNAKVKRRQGLCNLQHDAIAKARDDTAMQINRILLTFVGTALFCLLSLFTPDSALLANSEKLNLPFAGPVSFFGFVLLAPGVLIVLRVYLQIYVEHERRLDRFSLWLPTHTPTPDDYPLLRIFRSFALYLLLPLMMIAFSWKAAVFPYWGLGLLSVATAVIAMHLSLLVCTLTWRSRTFLSLGAAISVGAVMTGFEPLSRPFNLFRANLSEQWLPEIELKGADLNRANLAGANLNHADLSGADLFRADLTRTDLSDAKLGAANLTYSNLSTAALFRADLTGSELYGANLTDAKLNGAKLNGAKLNGAKLNGATLSGANFTSAHLSGADLTGADFFDIQLNGADLTEANLVGANLSADNGAELIGANLTNTNLAGANLAGTDLTGAILSDTNINGADISGTNLRLSRGLTQQQLDTACADAKTALPDSTKLSHICGQH
jgi:uncharacterized protein YjbI with pentapeptide repeats